MSLTPKIKQQLKARAHKLKPVVLIGHQGFTEAVRAEIEHALHDHELIKIRMDADDKELRKALFNEVTQSVAAELVQVIGKIAVIYKTK